MWPKHLALCNVSIIIALFQRTNILKNHRMVAGIRKREI